MTRFVLFLIILSVTSCTKRSKEDYPMELYIKKKVSFPISRAEFYFSHQTSVQDSANNTILYRENHNNNAIDIYNFTKQQKLSSIKFDREGPNRIGSFGGAAFLPLNKDSTFIATLSGKVHITQRDSVISSSRPLLEGTYFKFFAINSYLPQRIGNRIYMHVASHYRIKDPNFFSAPLIVSYDLSNGEVKVTDIKYPEIAKNYCWVGHQFKIPFTLNNKKELIVSFGFTEEIMVYNTELDSVVKSVMTAKSRYVQEIKPYTDCDSDSFETYFSYLKSTPRYFSLVYDKYRDVYYRIVLLPSDEIDGKRNEDVVMPMSIMLLDSHFNVLSEIKLPKRTYNYNDYFVDKDGFWLSNNNTGSESFDEDSLSFTLFQYKPKK